jgi:hypothetical protein
MTNFKDAGSSTGSLRTCSNVQKKKPSEELLLARQIRDVVRDLLSPLSLDDHRDVLGAIQLSLDSIISMPSHTRVRPDATARQSILQIHLDLLGLEDDVSFESLSQVLSSLTPRDLTNVLEHFRAESKIRELLSQLTSKAHLGVVIAIQAYFDTIVSLGLEDDVADTSSALESILAVWFPILGLGKQEHTNVLESLSEASIVFAPQDGVNVLECLRAEIQANLHADENV